MISRRWQCDSCNAVSLEAELLRAPSPFDPDDELVGCPTCKSCEGFTELCEIDGCEMPATCGGPVGGIYRRTCGPHAEWIRGGRGC